MQELYRLNLLRVMPPSERRTRIGVGASRIDATGETRAQHPKTARLGLTFFVFASGATHEKASHRHDYRRGREYRICPRVSRRIGSDARRRPADQLELAGDPTGECGGTGRGDGVEG